MKKENLWKPSFLVKLAFIAAVLLFPVTFVNAQTCTTRIIGTFSPTSGGNNFVFTRGFAGNTGGFNGSTTATFRFLNVSNLPFALQGDIPSTVTIQSSTVSPAFITNGRTVQPITGTLTITVRRASDNANLLTAVVVNNPNPSDIAGDFGANITGASYSASTGAQQITFTSDFLTFDPAAEKNLALAITSIQNRFFPDAPGTFTVEPFTSSVSGNFATCQTLSFMQPTAASAEISGRVLTPSGAGLSKARVTLTYPSGETVTTTTSSFGYYKFTGVESGQAIVLSVSSKRYKYAPKVLSVGEDLYESDFIPE